MLKFDREQESDEGTFPARPLNEEMLNAEDLEEAYLRALESIEAAESLPGMEPLEGADEPEYPSSQPLERVSSGFEKERNENQADLPDEIINRLSPGQIIEALLFVGGQPLTAKKIAGLFDAHVDHFVIESQIDELNSIYRDQNRPYEIRLGEGGYQTVLRPEFDAIRNRVYGIGPREVKLSQEALEVLALIAYRQPISHQQLLEVGRKNMGNVVRQLIRRELVAIERGEGGAKTVAYRTTARFLSLFGLSSLEELPQADELTLR